MNMQWSKRVLALSALLSMASVIGAVVYSRTFQQQPKVYQPALVKEAPPVISNIEGLQITEVRLTNQGTAQAAIEIDVTNNRDSAVMSLDFIWRHKQDSGGIAIDGLLEEDNPRVVIPPHTLKTFTWYLGEIPQGQTLLLGSAIFADGKEEGDQRSRRALERIEFSTSSRKSLKRSTEVSNENLDHCFVDRFVLILDNSYRFSTLRQHLDNTSTYIRADTRH